MDKVKKEAGTATRFIIVGIINTLFGCGLMFALYNLAGCSYWVSSAANYLAGSILSFILNRNYTFRHSGSVLKSLIRFAINIIVCYLFAYGLAKPFVFNLLECSSTKTGDNIAMLVGMTLFTVTNYFGQRIFAFRTTGNRNNTDK